MLKRKLVRGIVISNTCVKLYRNWIINEVARAGEHRNERTYVRTYVLTYIRTGQTLYPIHNFVVRGDNKVLPHPVCPVMTAECGYFGNSIFDFTEPSIFKVDLRILYYKKVDI